MKITVKIMLFLCLFGMISVQTFGAKKHKVYQKPVYMIGVAMSLTDSVVFITDMHLVDSVTVEKKTKFLKDRQLYSFQLQRYLEATYKGGPYVPAVFFSPKRKTMERHYLSLHNRYVQSKEFRMVLVDQSQFRFKSEKYIEEITE